MTPRLSALLADPLVGYRGIYDEHPRVQRYLRRVDRELKRQRAKRAAVYSIPLVKWSGRAHVNGLEMGADA